MKKLKIVVAALAMFVTASVSAQTAADATAKYNEAVELYNAKKYAEAIPVLESAISIGLDAGADAGEIVSSSQKLLPGSYFRSAVALCQQGMFEQAIPQITKAIEMGELYGDVKTVNNAKSLLSKAYVALGAEAFNTEDWPKAIEVFARGYAANPNDTDVAQYLAESYAKSGDMAGAMKVYNEVIALENNHSRYKPAADKARESLANYELIAASEAAKNGAAEEAYAAIDRVLAVLPNEPRAHMMRLQTANTKGDWARVIEWGEAAAMAQGADTEAMSAAYYLLGVAYQNSENTAKAIEIYRKVTSGQYAADAKTQIAALSK